MTNAQRGPGTGSAILSAAVSVAVVAGVVEGLTLMLVQETWRATYVSPTILWVSPAFDILVFGILGLCAVAGARLMPRLPWFRIALFAFLALAFVSWLAGTVGLWLRHYAQALVAAGLAGVLVRWVGPREAAVRRVLRRSAPWMVGGVLLLGAAVEGGGALRERRLVAGLPDASADAPNVLLVIMDAVRADHLGTYGYARATSPRLDRLAAEGVTFERALSASSFSLPSHASLLSGLYPHEHGAEWGSGRALLTCDCPWLAESLQQAGYRTGGFSGNPFWFTRDFGFDRGFIRFHEYFYSLPDMALRTMLGRALHRFLLIRLGYDDVPRYRAEAMNADILSWVDRHAESGRPFFVTLNYFDAHDPYVPPAPFRTRFAPPGERPGGIINQWSGPEAPELTPAQVASEVDAYDGGIAYIDHALGQLVDSLEARTGRGGTLVIVTADHGESFGEHGLYLHGHSLYREVIHVPLVVYWPGTVPGGIRVAQPASNVAVPATIARLAGLDPVPFRRPPLSGAWERPGAELSWPPPLAEQGRRPWGPSHFPSTQGWLRSTLLGTWHCIEYEHTGLAVYDWSTDPDELVDLSDQPGSADAVRACRSALAAVGGKDPNLRGTQR